jgi:uncharacterized protein YlxP (DUF503 family)
VLSDCDDVLKGHETWVLIFLGVCFVYSEDDMVAGLGIITFRLHDCRSLKGKRKVVKSIIGQLRNHFNVSVAEVGSNDIHQRAVIGFAMVGNNRGVINSKIDKIFNLVDALNLAEVIDSEMEIINL